MRWPSYDQSSSARIDGRICSDVTDVEVQRWCPRQLCRNSFAYAGRTSQAERFSQRVWRLRRCRGGVRSMSAIGTKRTCTNQRLMSAFGGKTDIGEPVSYTHLTLPTNREV